MTKQYGVRRFETSGKFDLYAITQNGEAFALAHAEADALMIAAELNRLRDQITRLAVAGQVLPRAAGVQQSE